jgi:hypothetical protein
VAFRWRLANEIRRENIAVRDKILKYLRKNIGQNVTGEELKYLAKDRSEWARRVRELRTEYGWPVVTQNTGHPDLEVGVYLLEADRQSPEHDRHIPDRAPSILMFLLARLCQQVNFFGNEIVVPGGCLVTVSDFAPQRAKLTLPMASFVTNCQFCKQFFIFLKQLASKKLTFSVLIGRMVGVGC